MKHPFDILPLQDGANLIFTPCPGTKGVDLQSSLQQLAAAGTTAILTLMPKDEMQRSAVVDLPQLCEHSGLEWFHLPIEDDHAPERAFEEAWQSAKTKIHLLLDAGKTIAIHCKGGTGRTGLVAARILLERGIPLNNVIAHVKTARPNALQIQAHQKYIAEIAQHIVI
jgi:protein-tyrosine phosphatase